MRSVTAIGRSGIYTGTIRKMKHRQKVLHFYKVTLQGHRRSKVKELLVGNTDHFEMKRVAEKVEKFGAGPDKVKNARQRAQGLKET